MNSVGFTFPSMSAKDQQITATDAPSVPSDDLILPTPIETNPTNPSSEPSNPSYEPQEPSVNDSADNNVNKRTLRNRKKRAGRKMRYQRFRSNLTSGQEQTAEEFDGEVG